ncbi:hypothetical protein E4U53_003720, partial [Claviceps sorghi]
MVGQWWPAVVAAGRWPLDDTGHNGANIEGANRFVGIESGGTNGRYNTSVAVYFP